MMNMRGPRPMHRPVGPHGHPGPARPPGNVRPPGPGMRPPGPGMRPPGMGPMGPRPGPQGGPPRPGGPPGPHQGPHQGGPPGPHQGGPPGPHQGGPPGPHPGPGGPPRPQGPGSNALASNKTNDPRGAHCRIFVGNLNTIAMSKEDVEGIFRRYGLVIGISMHKGYAFVQYNNHEEAKRASLTEGGKTYAGQTLDINIASEPKKGAKRNSGPNADGPSEKKAKTEGSSTVTSQQSNNPGGRNLVSLGGKLAGATISASATSITLSRPTGKALKKTTISTGNDILVCGNCKSLYSSLATFVQHKKQKCELKTLCKCQQIADLAKENNLKKDTSEIAIVKEPERNLLCAVCDVDFKTAWDLCQHCQEEHGIAIFKEQNNDDALLADDKNGVNGEKD